MAKSNHIQTTGKRKTSVARATVSKGTGKLSINGKTVEAYANGETLTLKIKEPLLITGLTASYDIKVNVFGGGQNSQAESIRQAIARALVELNGESLRKTFLDYDRSLLVSDTRFKEMKKPNNSHARAKRQKSYR
jgi:small subunit ribosomal protein S9